MNEEPQIEDTTEIERQAHEIVKPPKKVLGETPILKITLDGKPYYHFQSQNFDSKLAQKDDSMVIQGKYFYKGKHDNGQHSKMNLKSNK